MPEAFDLELERIAREVVGVPTLATRNVDDLDFHELAVWQIKALLTAAYIAGRNSK